MRTPSHVLLVVGALLLSTTSTYVTHAAACSEPAPTVVSFPRDGDEVGVDVVVQALLLHGADLDDLDDWELRDATDNVVDVTASVVDDAQQGAKLVHLTPTASLPPGAYTWGDEDNPVTFTVVDAQAFAAAIPSPTAGEQRVWDRDEDPCGPGGTYQFYELTDGDLDDIAFVVVTSSDDLSALAEVNGFGDAERWRAGEQNDVAVLLAKPGDPAGIRFGAFDHAGRFTGWSPVHVVLGVPAAADPTPLDDAGGCSSTSSSPFAALVVMGLLRRRRRP